MARSTMGYCKSTNYNDNLMLNKFNKFFLNVKSLINVVCACASYKAIHSERSRGLLEVSLHRWLRKTPTDSSCCSHTAFFGRTGALVLIK